MQRLVCILRKIKSLVRYFTVYHSIACEQAPVGRAERELASSEVARGSEGACGQRLYAAVLCTRFWCNRQLVRSLIVDRFD